MPGLCPVVRTVWRAGGRQGGATPRRCCPVGICGVLWAHRLRRAESGRTPWAEVALGEGRWLGPPWRTWAGLPIASCADRQAGASTRPRRVPASASSGRTGCGGQDRNGRPGCGLHMRGEGRWFGSRELAGGGVRAALREGRPLGEPAPRCSVPVGRSSGRTGCGGEFRNARAGRQSDVRVQGQWSGSRRLARRGSRTASRADRRHGQPAPTPHCRVPVGRSPGRTGCGGRDRNA